ncbi:hypothetical protein F511_36215 [Dorcoceras hygrometricum]|uniref:UBN2 domain-containing protein n=1 Tax=Dorcoceras hygrometricum TaxID=472368 RepID=A0A2Z7A5M8_9LAMI|nr:hypothetical protein F511_36215 [Dorcoceras hygrometricum]
MNTAVAIIAGAPQWIEKPRLEWTSEDKKKANLDSVAKYILYKMLDNNMFSKIHTCTAAKEIWEKLTQICEGNEETKEDKLTVALQKFELIKMMPEETMAEFDERFISYVIELSRLGKSYCNRELALKVMRALPKEWDVKTMAMQESKDLNKMELHDLFANIKAYVFRKIMCHFMRLCVNFMIYGVHVILVACLSFGCVDETWDDRGVSLFKIF